MFHLNLTREELMTIVDGLLMVEDNLRNGYWDEDNKRLKEVEEMIEVFSELLGRE